MADKVSSGSEARRTLGEVFLVPAAVAVVFLVSGIIAYVNTRTLMRDVELVTRTHDVLATLADVLSLVQDAESSQRGFIITGEERYLEPYTAALTRLDDRLDAAERLLADSSVHEGVIEELRSRVDLRQQYLAEILALRRNQGFEAARAVIASGRGKAAMDSVREQIEAIQETERGLRRERLAEMNNAYRVAVGSGIVTGVLGIVLAGVVAMLVRRAAIVRQRQTWLQSGQIGLSAALAGDQRVETLGDSLLKFLAEYLDAQAGAFFVEDSGTFRRVASYGVPAGGVPDRIARGEGLLGQAAKDGQSLFLHDVPENYLDVGSALGRSKPRHLAIVPTKEDSRVNGVIELGFVHAIDGALTELFERVAEPLGTAVRSANYRAHLQNLLEETQRQGEELQAQSEELRVSNEELEEQSRALRESQTRLEQQQAELEQINTQLEEQAERLESQRDESIRVNAALEMRSIELQKASKYKSDFLANMSHELRTPLNSSLILAKLLADNPEGNLTAEQVQYAETIRASGNDLLNLINDILDLSKIEAGRVDIHAEPFPLPQLIDDLGRAFQAVAAQKGLSFKTQILSGCPDELTTDRQRLEQILKNLVSNAVKFTEKGEVLVSASRPAPGRVAISVTDTGIGVPEEQQTAIFEAFQQADATTSRKYGGTGLGLSISRELARLLGGEIHLASEPGQGSTFTLTIPESFEAAVAPVRPTVQNPTMPLGAPAKVERATSGVAPDRAILPHRIPDDRERLTANSRMILVVEDDEAFARILYDLAHELHFQCVIATTAEEGFAVAVQYLPGAIVLDVGLPDHSGLAVLDRLKHDARTRHIPVHVVSAGDHAQTALSLGAVGYMLKPVPRESLAEALKGLEERLARRMRRVLVVEDDAIQRDSLQKLLGSHDVETVGVGTAADCLESLKTQTFDCMVLDLSLPDSSGYALLETLSREDSYSFPPVIVYTGRALSADEEQQLRRYSKSIIIKGAKSPERLLDEVTLFLHQVVTELPPEQQRMLEKARSRDSALEGRRILVVEDDVRNVFALSSILEPRGATVDIARNGREAVEILDLSIEDGRPAIDLILMDVMMPEMDGLTATREIRTRPALKKTPIIMLTAKAMKNDQEQCLAAGANDYMAKPLDVEKLLSLVRVWMPR